MVRASQRMIRACSPVPAFREPEKQGCQSASLIDRSRFCFSYVGPLFGQNEKFQSFLLPLVRGRLEHADNGWNQRDRVAPFHHSPVTSLVVV